MLIRAQSSVAPELAGIAMRPKGCSDGGLDERSNVIWFDEADLFVEDQR
jgi:hypothetical protein